jgi:hypothetical protein
MRLICFHGYWYLLLAGVIGQPQRCGYHHGSAYENGFRRHLDENISERQTSFSEALCDEEDDDGSNQASASKEIDQGETSGGKNRYY